jgi:alkylation response protein AidB-like acyl-CoA dehydrogenase
MDTILEADTPGADRPHGTVAGDLMARAHRILPAIAAGAADRERHRELPYAQLRHLARAQLLTFRIPPDHAGPGATVAETFEFIIDLAAADSNIAQACCPSFALIEGLRAGDSPQECDCWFPRALAGAVFGDAGCDIGGASGEVRTRITRRGDRYTVNGTKFSGTGARYADWISATAVDDDGEPVSFVVPRDREGLELLDDFDAMGQRLTASGTTNLSNVTVYPEEIRRVRRERRSPVTAFLQLYQGAVQAGIARNAMTDAVFYARDQARPTARGTATRSTDDPYVRHAVGEISAHAYAAEAAVLRAAGAIDRACAAQLPRNLLTAAAVEVAQAQFVATNAALKAAELAFDVGGGSATAQVHNLDRHWRNARTVASHNPRAWKAATVGAYRLTGAEPVTSGLF